MVTVGTIPSLRCGSSTRRNVSDTSHVGWTLTRPQPVFGDGLATESAGADHHNDFAGTLLARRRLIRLGYVVLSLPGRGVVVPYSRQRESTV